VIPPWAVWLAFAVTGVVAGLLVNDVVAGNALAVALYSPLCIVYLVFDAGVVLAYLDDPA
jgi:hypothetical protein